MFCTVSNLFGTAMKLDKYGKSRFEFLCAKIPDPGCERITFSASMSQSKSERFKDTQKRHSKKLGGSMPTLYKSAVHPTSAWREKPPSQACPLCHERGSSSGLYHRTMRSHWKSIAKSGLLPGEEILSTPGAPTST